MLPNTWVRGQGPQLPLAQGQQNAAQGQTVTQNAVNSQPVTSGQTGPQQQTVPTPPQNTVPTQVKSKTQQLNEKTRERQGSVADSSLVGLQKLRNAFEGYKVGDEQSYLDVPAEDPIAEKAMDATLEVADKGSTISGIASDIAEMAGKELSKWSNGNGIVGAALSFIKYIKEAYSIMTSDATKREKAGALVKETANTAFEMAGDIMDVIEGFGGTVLKGLKVIPGLGMVIDAIEIGISVYRIMKADRARVRMNDSRRLFKEKYAGKSVSVGGKATAMVKKVGKYNVKRLWKKTDETVDESAMKARRSELLNKRKNDPTSFTEDEQAELTDILSYSTQDRLRRVNRNKELENVGSIVMRLGSIAAKISAMVGTFGASALAESVAGGIDLAIDTTGLAKDAGSMIRSMYNKRGDRDKGSQYTKYLLEVIGHLPSDYSKEAFKQKYAEASDMVDATGVNTKKVYQQAEVIEGLAEADKKKGRSKAFDMFIQLFGD